MGDEVQIRARLSKAVTASYLLVGRRKTTKQSGRSFAISFTQHHRSARRSHFQNIPEAV